jgi:hypothetical protein
MSEVVVKKYVVRLTAEERTQLEGKEGRLPDTRARGRNRSRPDDAAR